MATTKANSAKAGNEPVTQPEGEGTKLAQVSDPAKLTNKRINEIAGEHGDKSDPEQAANADVAEALKDAKAEAKSTDDPVPTYFHGQGGAAGL